MDSNLQPGGVVSPSMNMDEEPETIAVRIDTPQQSVSQPTESLAEPASNSTVSSFDTDTAPEVPSEISSEQTAEYEPSVETANTQSQQVSVAPETNGQPPTTEPVQASTANSSDNPQDDTSPNPTLKKKRFNFKKKTLAMALIIAVAVIGGGSAAAYFGVMVPNKPENKLISAFTNLASQKSLTTTGIIDYAPAGSTDVSFTYKLASNTEKSQYSFGGTLAVNDVQFPYELRYLDKNIYLKVGGLDSISKILPKTNGGVDYSKITKSLNDQWFVIESSMLDSVGVKTSCLTDMSLSLTDGDINLISSAYKKHPLFKVKSSTNETIDGTPTTKYVVDPASDSDAAAFANELKNLSLYKKVNDCVGSSANGIAESGKTVVTESSASGTIALYITSNKQLKKLEIVSKDTKNSMKINAVFSYGEVTVAKPEGAKSFQTIFNSLFSGMTQQVSGLQVKADDVERKTDINYLQSQLESYWAQNGFYPSLNEMNSATFISAKLTNFDNAALKDPAGSGSTLVAAPVKGAYSYAVKPTNCDNASKGKCTGYTLTATLGDGTTYSKLSLN